MRRLFDCDWKTWKILAFPSGFGIAPNLRRFALGTHSIMHTRCSFALLRHCKLVFKNLRTVELHVEDFIKYLQIDLWAMKARRKAREDASQSIRHIGVILAAKGHLLVENNMMEGETRLWSRPIPDGDKNQGAEDKEQQRLRVRAKKGFGYWKDKDRALVPRTWRWNLKSSTPPNYAQALRYWMGV
jgi:hypothetical protein